MEEQVRSHNEIDNTNRLVDFAAMQNKWGVSEAELKKAIREVGFDQPRIEEYLVNHKWQTSEDENIF